MDGTVVIQGLFTLHRHLSGIRAPHRRGFFYPFSQKMSNGELEVG